MRAQTYLFLALVALVLGGCSALNHFGEFREGMDAGPRPDVGQDAFELPDAGVPDAPVDAPVADDANADAASESDANTDAR